MNSKELERAVNSLAEDGQWNCYYEFPNKITTRTCHINSPGYNLNKWERLKPIVEKLSIEDKTIIDIGCGDGFYAIQCAKMGCKYVLGSDIDSLRIKRANLAKEVYGLDNVEFKSTDLYEDDIEKFDVLLGLGLLHRVPDIESCLDKMSQIADTLILEFKTYDTDKKECLKLEAKTKANNYNKFYSVPSINFVKSFLQSKDYVNFNILFDESSGLRYKRSIILASRL